MEQNTGTFKKNLSLREDFNNRRSSQPKYFSNQSSTRDKDITSQSQLSNYQKGAICKSQRWITKDRISEHNTTNSTAKQGIPISDLKTLSEYVTAKKGSDDRDSLIYKLQQDLETLKHSMRSEIDDLKNRLLLCEQNNQKLMANVKNQIEHKQQTVPKEVAKPEFYAIAEEYKSKKREIQEFALRAEAVPTIGFNIKELQKITAQRGKVFGVKKSVQIPKAKVQEPRLKVHNSFLMKTPEPARKAPPTKDEEIETEQSLQLALSIKPQESPFRGFQNSMISNQPQKTLDTFGDSSTKNPPRFIHKPTSSISSLPHSPIVSHREANNKSFHGLTLKSMQQSQPDRSYRESSKSQLGISTVIDNPKFLDFVNANTSRQSQGFSLISSIFGRKPSKENTSLINPVRSIATQQSQEESKRVGDMSPSYFYKKWLDITSKERTCESNQSTERGEKPSIKNRHMVDSRVNKMEQSTSSMDDEEMESDDCDEKRSYTPEPKHQNNLISEPPKSLNHSIIGLRGQPTSTQNVNQVYSSSRMEISKYISNNKSAIDHKNSYNFMELGGKQALIDNKGSKCICKKAQQFQPAPTDKKSVCGTYCKNLSPMEQKKVILDCLQKDLNQGNQSVLGKSGTKQKKYLLEGKWWRKWCDYVNFDSSNLNASFNTLSDQLDEMNSVKRDSKVTRTYDSSTLYCKPDRILNENLLDKKQKGSQQELRENLVENYDFVSIPPLVWTHLYSWYSADCMIARYLKKDKLNTHSFMLELYPDRNKNLSFLGYGSSSDEESDSDGSRDVSSAGGTPDVKIIKQDPAPLQKQKTTTQHKGSFFGLVMPQKANHNRSQDFGQEIKR